MGYYTFYNMEIKTGSHTVKEIVEFIEERKLDFAFWKYKGKEEDSYTLTNQNISYDGCDCVKWYEASRDIRNMSEYFPDAVFTLYGNGEEHDDEWEEQFKNGEVRSRHIIFKWSKWDKPEFK